MNAAQEWLALIQTSALEPGDVTAVDHEQVLYAVYDTPAGIVVSHARCPHAGANLCDGYFDGYRIECPLHQALFDVRSGRVLSAPATHDLQIVDSRVVGGTVQIRLRPPDRARWRLGDS